MLRKRRISVGGLVILGIVTVALSSCRGQGEIATAGKNIPLCVVTAASEATAPSAGGYRVHQLEYDVDSGTFSPLKESKAQAPMDIVDSNWYRWDGREMLLTRHSLGSCDYVGELRGGTVRMTGTGMGIRLSCEGEEGAWSDTIDLSGTVREAEGFRPLLAFDDEGTTRILVSYWKAGRFGFLVVDRDSNDVTISKVDTSDITCTDDHGSPVLVGNLIYVHTCCVGTIDLGTMKLTNMDCSSLKPEFVSRLGFQESDQVSLVPVIGHFEDSMLFLCTTGQRGVLGGIDNGTHNPSFWITFDRNTNEIRSEKSSVVIPRGERLIRVLIPNM